MQRRQRLAVAVVLTAGGSVTGEHGGEDMARVLEVRPVYAEVAAGEPYRQCWKLGLPPAVTKVARGPEQAPPMRRCILLQRARLRQEQVGFRVKYRYRGRVGTLLTGRPPDTGDRIRLRYRWRPVFF